MTASPIKTKSMITAYISCKIIPCLVMNINLLVINFFLLSMNVGGVSELSFWEKIQELETMMNSKVASAVYNFFLSV